MCSQEQNKLDVNMARNTLHRTLKDYPYGAIAVAAASALLLHSVLRDLVAIHKEQLNTRAKQSCE